MDTCSPQPAQQGSIRGGTEAPPVEKEDIGRSSTEFPCRCTAFRRRRSSGSPIGSEDRWHMHAVPRSARVLCGREQEIVATSRIFIAIVQSSLYGSYTKADSRFRVD